MSVKLVHFINRLSVTLHHSGRSHDNRAKSLIVFNDEILLLVSIRLANLQTSEPELGNQTQPDSLGNFSAAFLISHRHTKLIM